MLPKHHIVTCTLPRKLPPQAMETESSLSLAVGLGYFPICLGMESYKQLIDKRLPVERRGKAICQGERHYYYKTKFVFNNT